MTLAEKTKLVDDMIRENRDATIKDYLDLTKELAGIRSSRLKYDRQSNDRYKMLRKERSYAHQL